MSWKIWWVFTVNKVINCVFECLSKQCCVVLMTPVTVVYTNNHTFIANKCFYPSIRYLLCFSCYSSQDCWSQLQLSVGKTQGTLWTSWQSITRQQPLTLTFTSMRNLESQITEYMFLDFRMSPEYLEETHAGTRRMCKLNTESCEVTLLTATMPPNIIL